MEDEQGDLGGVSASSLGHNSPSGRNQVEGSYEEGEDGGEIMVEVVGSDVLVDGVSGNKESELGLGLGGIRDLESGNVWENRDEPDGTQNFLESMDVSTKEDEYKMVESTELKLSVLGDERSVEAVKEVDANLSEFACSEAVLGCGLPAGGVDISGDVVGSQLPAVDTDVGMETVPAVVSEDGGELDEGVKDRGDVVKLVVSNCPVEAIDDEEIGVVEKREVLSSTDRDFLGVDLVGCSAADGGEVMASKVSLDCSREETKDVQVEGINIVVGGVGSDNNNVGEELVAEDSKFVTADELVTDDGACGDAAKLSDQQENSAAEIKSIVDSDAVVADVVDESQGYVHKFHRKKLESANEINDVSHTNSESVVEKSVVFEKVEAVVAESGADNVASDVSVRDSSSMGDEKCIMTEEDLKSDIIHQSHDHEHEPTQLTDGFDTAEANKDDSPSVVNGVETVENQPHMISSSCSGDDKIAKNHTVDAASEGEAMDCQNEATVHVDSKMSKQSLDSHVGDEIPTLDPSTENVELSSCVNVEMGDRTATESYPTVNSQADSADIAEFGSCQSMELQISTEVVETPTDEAQKHENINLATNETSQMSMLPDIAEKAELPMSESVDNPTCELVTSIEKGSDSMEIDDSCVRPDGLCFVEDQNPDAQLMDFEPDRAYHGGMTELESEGAVPENEDMIFFNEDELVKPDNFSKMNISSYLLPEDEGYFSPLDLVWGKVRSHPWWPGQIFDPADASEKAVKHYKKDAYLIAYFGDQTFAWNDASELKPFRSHFSEIEKENNSEEFQNAVSCALGEVSRRVELSLSCSCMAKDAYGEIGSQVVENAGIREESSRKYGLDRCSQATYFSPHSLLDYIQELARHAPSGADRLDLAIAQAQLSAFCRMKGYRLPTGFPTTGELLENVEDSEQIDAMDDSLKCKNILENDSESRKEKSMAELMGEGEFFPDAEDDPLSSGRKQKALDSLDDGSDKRMSSSAAKYPAANQPLKPSFKIGECIRRVANQLKGNNDETAPDGSPMVYEHSERRSILFSAESYSSDEILLQLQLLALDPKKGENILNTVHNFFMGFRSSIALNRRGRKKKADSTVGGSGEEFEFDDVNDSYWTDRIVHNYPEEQVVNNSSENREGTHQVLSFGEERMVKPGRKSRKRYSTMSFPTGESEIEESAKRKKQESSPAELILNFAERNCLPTEIKLNKMFRRFGPLMESETEVDHDSGRARVIFKRGSDAEVARNSSEKFNIFGPVLVNYQIGYSPLISVKISPVTLPQMEEDVTLLI
ncbi:uncharacterized protein LOC127243967 [Andrographis paniculata]|uniref:uncharacterized protein LOC127243967 n=1 Tax=Andrographis paniculata TaxID=175694 RepID=UPI0021E81028|nr:uncharacterized protein LOC127243967 [Andrographis paniculata]